MAMTKDQLIKHAEKAGLDVDQRWGRDRLISEMQNAGISLVKGDDELEKMENVGLAKKGDDELPDGVSMAGAPIKLKRLTKDEATARGKQLLHRVGIPEQAAASMRVEEWDGEVRTEQLDRLRDSRFVLGVGRGRWDNPPNSFRMAGVLGSRGIGMGDALHPGPGDVQLRQGRLHQVLGPLAVASGRLAAYRGST